LVGVLTSVMMVVGYEAARNSRARRVEFSAAGEYMLGFVQDARGPENGRINPAFALSEARESLATTYQMTFADIQLA